MKRNCKRLLKPFMVAIISSIMISACTATVKVPKHPAPGEPPPPPPKVEVHR